MRRVLYDAGSPAAKAAAALLADELDVVPWTGADAAEMTVRAPGSRVSG